MATVARVTLKYTSTRAELVRVELIEAPSPRVISEPTLTSTGAWVTVFNPKGEDVFHRLLPDPHIGGEVRYEGSMRRLPSRRGAQFASVEVPWPGDGSRITVHARRIVPRQTRTRNAKGTRSEIARLRLKPEKKPKTKRVTRGLFSSAPKFDVKPDLIWGHDNPKALNLVFLPEGFLKNEMASFHAKVDAVIALFGQTNPLRSLLPALKVSRIEIPSETNTIGSKAGRTFFKARFTTEGIARVIEIDQTKASAVIAASFPTRSARALVVVNTTTYGGSGGVATVFSCDPQWSPYIAIHELGHSHFGLADEYSDAGQAATKDPVEPNVCGGFERSVLKWANMVDQNTPLPTWRAGDPVPAKDRVGAFEGGKYQVHGIWRPAFNCKMRNVDVRDFCPVCERVIRMDLEPRLPKPIS